MLSVLAASTSSGKLPLDKKASGAGNWVSEVAWRDFYNHIIAAYPRVSMGQPFNAKYRGVQVSSWLSSSSLRTCWRVADVDLRLRLICRSWFCIVGDRP